MTRLIEQVISTVEARRTTYGSPTINMRRTAQLLSAYLGIKILPEQVPVIMQLVKIARLAETPRHLDSHLDIAGYVDVADQVIRDEIQREQAARKNLIRDIVRADLGTDAVAVNFSNTMCEKGAAATL